jgi:dTDP-4-amino-4,6-dideoxygalactose transaminase
VRKIPILDLMPEIEILREELIQVFEGVLDSGKFIMGPNVKAFEAEVARYLGVKHAISVNSGTDALIIGLRAAGIDKGDEVITTSFTFFATVEAIEHIGAKPIFVDINPISFNLDVRKIEAAITPRTKAILPVHLYGQAAEMREILRIAKQFGLKVIEDVAQAFGGEYRGQKLGTFGEVGCFSFFPSKNLGAYGDGGLLVTNDDTIAQEASKLRVHGAKKKYFNEAIGYNSRLDEIQAAILRVKLKRIEDWNEGRRSAANHYHEMLSNVNGVVTSVELPDRKHVYHQYSIRIKNGNRDKIQQALAEKGVETIVYYPVPVHCLPIYKNLKCSLPLAEEASGEVLSLPIWPQIKQEDQERVVDLINRFNG